MKAKARADRLVLLVVALGVVSTLVVVWEDVFAAADDAPLRSASSGAAPGHAPTLAAPSLPASPTNESAAVDLALLPVGP